MFTKKRAITQLPVAIDSDSSTANPYKYVANSSQSEESVVADSKTSASTPPAIFDVNQLLKRTSSSSSSTFDVMSCKCVILTLYVTLIVSCANATTTPGNKNFMSSAEVGVYNIPSKFALISCGIRIIF